MLERLQKIISAAGITSRRAAEGLIAEGRVRVNGKVVTELGSKADASKDHIKVDGKLINPQQPPTYVMLNKPAGYVTTMSDPEGRPTVQDLLKGIKTRVYPVGRLDYNTEGLLLLTNDGDFAHLITHPKHEFPKTYLAKVKGVLEERQIEMLEKGMFLQDGKTAPARVRKIRKEEANSWVEITIHEGRKRQVRRMFDHVGRSVIKLKRTRTGSLSLGDLPEGRFRHLTLDEVNALRETAMKTDDSGQQVRVYKPVVKAVRKDESPEPGTMAEGRHRPEFRTQQTDRKGTTADFSRPGTSSRRPGTGIMQDTRGGLRKNQGRARPGMVHDQRTSSRKGFDRREAPARRPASQKPGPGAARSKPSFSSRGGFNRREAGGTGSGTRPASRRPAPGTGSRPGFSSREGFNRREAGGTATATRPASRRPGPGTGSRPGFSNPRAAGRGAGSEGRWQPSGPRPNKSRFTGSKGGQARGTRPGPKGRGGASSRGPRR